MQETRQNRISRLLQKELAAIFQSQTRLIAKQVDGRRNTSV